MFGESSITSNMIGAFLGRTKRKSIEAITIGLKESTPDWIRSGIEAARIAPSATNKQPWEFKIKKDFVIVSVSLGNETNKFSPKLDCGIEMLHFEIGTKHHGSSDQWAFLSEPDVAVFRHIKI